MSEDDDRVAEGEVGRETDKEGEDMSEDDSCLRSEHQRNFK